MPPKPKVAALDLGVSSDHVDKMQRRISKLEREIDAISLTPIRQAINARLVEIRLLLRDGHLENLNCNRRT